MIYFVQASIGGPIKIGYAVDPAKRLRDLQTGSPFPLRLLLALPGDLNAERAMHLRFATDRLHGEWFDPSAALRAFIATEAATVPTTRRRLVLEGPVAELRVVALLAPMDETRTVIVDALRQVDWTTVAALRARTGLATSAITGRLVGLRRRGWIVSRRMQRDNGEFWTSWRLVDAARGRTFDSRYLSA